MPIRHYISQCTGYVCLNIEELRLKPFPRDGDGVEGGKVGQFRQGLGSGSG